MQIAFILRYDSRTVLLCNDFRQGTDSLRRLCRYEKFRAMAIGSGRTIGQHLLPILFDNASCNTVAQVWNGKAQANGQQAQYNQNYENFHLKLYGEMR